MRLIDADALEKRFADSSNGCAGECECCKHYISDKWRNGWCGLIVNAPTIGGWISADTYPDMAGQSYLLTVRNVHYGDVRVIIGHTGYGLDPWYTSDQIYMEDFRAGDNRLSHNYVVTHWMPLPEPLRVSDAPMPKCEVVNQHADGA
jgi:hypothetical protein